MLLWKGFEIYLKNGKSYLFNFSTTKEYNDFIENFIMKSRLKNLLIYLIIGEFIFYQIMIIFFY